MPNGVTPWPHRLTPQKRGNPAVTSDPRQELAAILDQTAEYLSWLKEDGVGQIEVSRSVAGTPLPVPVPVVPVREMKPVPPKEIPVMPPSKKKPAGAVDSGLASIASEIARCTKCPLHRTRTNTVPGQGSPHPEVMFIGEAPGADEDEQGLAFVGRAGQLLTKMVEAMGFTRDEVFIANILKCRPPANRQPTPEEMAVCIPFLKQQIALVQPKVIVALGAVSVLGLLDMTGITKLRGTWQKFEGIDVMPTFHPAYLLRNPPSKKEAWADLLSVLKRLGRTAPPVKKAE